jgi:tubulin-specific chaperone D
MSDSGLRPLEDWLPPSLYHEAFSGILKQGSGRLDNVRQEAGQQVVALLRMAPTEGLSGVDWIPAGHDLMCQLFLE